MRTRLSAGFGAALTLLLTATPVRALDFSAHPLFYQEDYVGETAYPTMPEVDLANGGGATGFESPPVTAGGPTLTGSAAHVSLTDSSAIDTQWTRAPGIGIGAADIGIRGRFSVFTVIAPIAGSGTAEAGVMAVFAAAPTGWQVTCSVELTSPGGTGSVFLRQIDSSTGTVVGSTSVGVLLPTAVALAMGAFHFDLLVDRATSTASCSLGLPSTSDLTTPSLALSSFSLANTFAEARQFAAEGAAIPQSFEIDLTTIELYGDVANRSFNVDAGTFRGAPSDTYGAAGLTGTWNGLPLGISPLVDTNGLPTGATATVSASFLGGSSGGSGDPLALFGDHATSCTFSGWSLGFAGLTSGPYRVFVYAPAQLPTGLLDINGASLPPLPGAPGFELIEGTSWLSTTTVVTDGTLSVSGTASPVLCTGIAGVQLVPITAKAPTLAGAAMALLVALLCGLGWILQRPEHPAHCL